ARATARIRGVWRRTHRTKSSLIAASFFGSRGATVEGIFHPEKNFEDCIVASPGKQLGTSDLDLVGTTPFRQQLHVTLVIFVAKERRLPAVPPLRDMVRQPRCDNSCKPGHGRNLPSPPPRVRNCVWCPRNPGRVRSPRILPDSAHGAEPGGAPPRAGA